MAPNTATIDALNGTTETALPLDPTRPASVEDAATLGNVWRKLYAQTKITKQAHSEFAKALATNAYANVDTADLERQSRKLGELLIESRMIIDELPNGTTAKGGATRQTVILQFFGPVNRDLKTRISASEAAKVNKLSFGGK